MKKLFFFLFLFSYIVYANTINNLTQNEKDFISTHPIINVGAETDWPPFDFVENGQYTGLARDYLELIEIKTGLKFNYVTDSWSNLLEKTKNKELDLLPILAKTKDREKYLLYTDKYLTIRDYIFSSNKEIKSINHITNMTIAIPKGYAQEEYFRKNHPNMKIYSTKNLLESIDAVITQKADVFVSNVAIVNYLNKKHSITNIKANFHMGYSGNMLHMAVRDDFSILRSIIQKALNDVSFTEQSRITSKWMDVKSTKSDKNSLLLTAKEKSYIKEKRKVYIANEMDWIPYDYNENNTPKGYVIDYIKLICDKVGLEPHFITDNWTSLMKRFKQGEIDILPVISYNKKREDYLLFTQSFMQQDFTIVTKSSKTNLINIDDLKNKKLGLVKDWNSTKKIKENYPYINVIEFESLKDVFDAIKNNFIDATIQNRMISNYYVNKNYQGHLKTGTSINLKDLKNELYMGIQKDSDLLHSIIDKTISNISRKELIVLENKWINISKGLKFTEEEKHFIDNKVINIAYTDNWEPLSFVENGKPYGLGFDFWKYVVEKANLKVNTTIKKTFSNALKDIKSKKSDIIITTSKTNDRENYSIFSDVYYKAPVGIATLQEKNYIPDASYLLGKKVGVGKNFTAHRLLQEKYPSMNFVFVNNIKEGLEQLSKNEIDVLVDNMPVLAHNIQKNAYSNIKISGSTGIDFKLQMMIREDYHLLQSIINKVLINMSPEEKNSIYNKWSKLEYEEPFDYSVLWKYFLPLIIIILFILYKNRELIKYQKTLKNTQNELEKSLKSFKALVNITIEGIVILRNEKIVFSNNEALKMFDLKADEILKRDISSLFGSDQSGDINKVIKSNNSHTSELTAIKSNGNKFPTLVKSKKIDFENNESTIISIIDMSEIKEKENLLIQQSKMASLGEMIANIAHQWRQPLSYISTAASGMKFQKEYDQLDDKEFINTLDSITNTTTFLSQTIDDFQNYITNDKFMKEFNINSSIDKILNIIKGAFVNHFIILDLNLEDNLIIKSYENELNQVLLNILNNSKDALKERPKDDRFIAINTYMKLNTIHIEIIDNAGGIDSSIIDKIFEPYFTTKHKSQGTGLGLYMTHKIITESMKGQINILNVGYTFNEKYFDDCTKVLIRLPIS